MQPFTLTDLTNALRRVLAELHDRAAALPLHHLDLPDRVAVVLNRDRCRADGATTICPLAAYARRRLGLDNECRVAVMSEAKQDGAVKPAAATIIRRGVALTKVDLPDSLSEFCRRFDRNGYPELKSLEA